MTRRFAMPRVRGRGGVTQPLGAVRVGAHTDPIRAGGDHPHGSRPETARGRLGSPRGLNWSPYAAASRLEYY
jgi:hypothetical protein